MRPFKAKLRSHSNIIFTCEHASGRIPREYHQLGLTRRELQGAKDWYDVGALDLMKQLATAFHASFLYTTFSRLVIDANRVYESIVHPTDSFYTPALKQSLLVENDSEERMIVVPGNQLKDAQKEGKRRWKKYVQPYYSQGERMLHTLCSAHESVYVIPIHSFSSVYNGDVRTVDIDVLSSHTYPRTAARRLLQALPQQSRMKVGDNTPWAMDTVGGGIWGSFQNNPKIHVMPLDINQRHLMDKESSVRMSEILIASLQAVDIV